VRPVRLQLSRKRGFNLQALSLATNGLPAVNAARPGPLGNPFTGEGAAERFRDWLTSNYSIGDLLTTDLPALPARKNIILDRLPLLVGHNLACWCKPGTPCHADVLLELANPRDRG